MGTSCESINQSIALTNAYYYVGNLNEDLDNLLFSCENTKSYKEQRRYSETKAYREKISNYANDNSNLDIINNKADKIVQKSGSELLNALKDLSDEEFVAAFTLKETKQKLLKHTTTGFHGLAHFAYIKARLSEIRNEMGLPPGKRNTVQSSSSISYNPLLSCWGNCDEQKSNAQLKNYTDGIFDKQSFVVQENLKSDDKLKKSLREIKVSSEHSEKLNLPKNTEDLKATILDNLQKFKGSDKDKFNYLAQIPPENIYQILQDVTFKDKIYKNLCSGMWDKASIALLEFKTAQYVSNNNTALSGLIETIATYTNGKSELNYNDFKKLSNLSHYSFGKPVTQDILFSSQYLRRIDLILSDKSNGNTTQQRNKVNGMRGYQVCGTKFTDDGIIGIMKDYEHYKSTDSEINNTTIAEILIAERQ